MCLSLRAIMSEAVVHTFLKKRGETKRYVGAVVSFGGGSHRCGSRVMPLSFFFTNTAFERKRGNHFFSHRCPVCMAYLRFIVLWVLPHFLWKGIKWKVIYRLLNGHFLECRLFFSAMLGWSVQGVFNFVFGAASAVWTACRQH